MEKAVKKFLFKAIVLLIFGISIISFVSAETMVSYEIDPEEPKPLSEVTIIAELDSTDVTQIYLEMQECTSAGICYGWDTNVSMDNLGNNMYQAQITLEHSDAIYFSLRSHIERDGEWEQTAEHKVNLNLEDTGNGNGSNTPGFEIILLFISIVMGMILVKRKRS